MFILPAPKEPFAERGVEVTGFILVQRERPWPRPRPPRLEEEASLHPALRPPAERREADQRRPGSLQGLSGKEELD